MTSIHTLYEAPQFRHFSESGDIPKTNGASPASAVIDLGSAEKAKRVSDSRTATTHVAQASSSPELRTPAVPVSVELAEAALANIDLMADEELMDRVFEGHVINSAQKLLAAINLAGIDEFLRTMVDEQSTEMAKLLLADITEGLTEVIDARESGEKPKPIQIIDLLCALMMMLLIMNESEIEAQTTASKVARANVEVEAQSYLTEGIKGMSSAIAGFALSVGTSLATMGLQQYGLLKEHKLMTDKNNHARDLNAQGQTGQGQLTHQRNLSKATRDRDYAENRSAKLQRKQDKQIADHEAQRNLDKSHFEAEEGGGLKAFHQQTRQRADRMPPGQKRDEYMARREALGDELNAYNGDFTAFDTQTRARVTEIRNKYTPKIALSDAQAQVAHNKLGTLTAADQAITTDFELRGQTTFTIRSVVQSMMGSMALLNLVQGISGMLQKQENAIQALSRQDANISDKVSETGQQNASSARALIDRIKEEFAQFLNNQRETYSAIANHFLS